MKNFFIACLVLLVVCVFPCFAVTPGTTNTIGSNWQLFSGLFLSVYEVLARFVLKGKKYSILEFIVKVITSINTVIPNREK